MNFNFYVTRVHFIDFLDQCFSNCRHDTQVYCSASCRFGADEPSNRHPFKCSWLDTSLQKSQNLPSCWYLILSMYTVHVVTLWIKLENMSIEPYFCWDSDATQRSKWPKLNSLAYKRKSFIFLKKQKNANFFAFPLH